MTKPIFEDTTDDQGIFHSKEDLEHAWEIQQAAIEAERIKVFNIGIRNNIVREVTKRLNAFAKVKGWSSIDSLAIRAGYPGPYNEVAIHAATLADNTLKMIDDIFEDVEKGLREHPNSFDAIEAELPKLEWP